MYDVVIVGGGPAGMSAAIAAAKAGGKVLLIERERHLGGILKQCIHDGFGLIRYKKMLTGPEYALMDVELLEEMAIDVKTMTFVTDIVRKDVFELTLVNGQESIVKVKTLALILANGCRERTGKQIFIGGTRPAGVYTAGTAQYLVNIDGYLPCKKCVVLGSGDIGLIMARRLTLEGAQVLGVYEVKDKPSGLNRNIVQCLKDYHIPLHLSKTMTRILGRNRVEAVEIMDVDETMQPIKGTEEIVECDGVILSVGLIPENELAELLGVELDPQTKGPIVDQNLMTSLPGVFSCGNALHVNDLVDYVSESGDIAGRGAVAFAEMVKDKNSRKGMDAANSKYVNVDYDKKDFLYVVPQKIRCDDDVAVDFYVRSRVDIQGCKISVIVDDEVAKTKRYMKLSPPEMEKLTLRKCLVNYRVELVLERGEKHEEVD